MKKIFAITLVLALFLAGCQKPIEDTVTEPPTQPVTEAPTEEATEEVTEPTPTVQYEQQEMLAVSVPVDTETVTADDGTVIFSHKYQNIQLINNDPAVADSIILDFFNRQNDLAEDVEAIRQQAQDEYTGSENWAPYFYNMLYSPTRIDQSVLSFFGTNTSYTGGNHSNTVCAAANYNMLTGEVLTLGSILYHIDAKETLIDLVIQKADTIAEDAQLFPGYDEAISMRFAREESFDEDWYFTKNGLCFYFSPYEIAPYYAGVISLEIPYNELTGVIADEFFPPEEDLLEGTIACQLLSHVDTTAYTQSAELLTSVDGESFLLYADGAVRDVTIETGYWDESGVLFTPDAVVFATYTLTPGDAVTIKADIPDTMSNIRISYRSGDEIHQVFLSQSGKDGSALLLGA